MNARRGWLTFLAVATIALFGATELAAQEGSRVQGQATNAATGQPLAGAQVFIPGTGLGTLTNEEGRFLLLNVPAGERTIRLELIGYRAAEQVVNIGADETVTVNFELEQSAISLDELVVTGVAGETEKAKLPFTVDRLQTEDMPVPQANAVSSLQGKVAGATVVNGSGRPGDAPTVLLRGATSINAAGRNQEPLYIVDGVILGSEMVDIGGLDIASVEVVKGAAAASLYGSRAGNGVIQITTQRGRNVADNEVRYSARSEMGRSGLRETPASLLSEHHQYALTSDGSQFVDGEGDACDWLTCPSVAPANTNAWDTYAVHEWPGGARDQVGEIFNQGQFMENYVSASGRSGATNFHASFSHLNQEGVLPGLDGFERLNFRVNVDQAVREDVHVSASAFYSRSTKDTGGAQLFDVTRMPAGVDLWACEDGTVDENGNSKTDCSDDPENLVLIPDPTNTESPNPLYDLLNIDSEANRGRFLGAADLRYSPVNWLDLSANMSYDRLDYERTDFVPKGFRTPSPSTSLNNGNLWRRVEVEEALNSSVKANFRFDLTDQIRNNTTVQYLYERDDFERTQTEGYEFAVGNVPTFDNINTETLEAESLIRPVRADGYFFITDFDVADRYVLNILARNDGSSLFGVDERRHWYYRVGGSWLMGREEWFPLPIFNEFKLRYALGTAGNRPRFVAQYETFNVGGGRITPVALGNKKLKPEHSQEQEMGLDAVMLDGRIGLTLTYATTNTRDQILPVPLLGPTGYSEQWQNAGTLESNTWEASLDAQLAQTADFSWSARLIYDRTRSEITELTTAPFNYGVNGQGLGSVFFAAEGEELGNYYGVQFAENCGHLPEGMDCNEFRVNDEGLLVWTGGEELSADDWGTNSGMTIYGKPVMWGTPIAGQCTDRRTGEPSYLCNVGNSMPDYNVSFSTDMSYRGLSLYALVDAVQGFDIYNQPLQWAVFRRTAGIYDQSNVPEADRRPLGYWDATYGVSGLMPSSYFVEDGSFVKLREVSLRYRFDRDILSSVPGIDRLGGLTLMLTGRNLLTSTDYRGYDPEIGRGGGDTGSAAIARVDGYQYPNFRTWTLGVEVNF